MFVFDKSRKNTMVGRGGQGQTRALLLRNLSSPREDKTDAQRQFRAVHMQLQMNGKGSTKRGSESSIGTGSQVGFLEEEVLTWAVKNGLCLPDLSQE